MDNVILSIQDLTKKYGDLVALDHFSAEFMPGVYGILGANGAGKSTLMNLITDSIHRDGGSICFMGRETGKKNFGHSLVICRNNRGCTSK